MKARAMSGENSGKGAEARPAIVFLSILSIIASILFFSLSPAFSEIVENLTVVEVTVSFVSGKPEIKVINLTRLELSEETGEGYAFNPPGEGSEYSIVLYSEGERTNTTAAVYQPRGVRNFDEWSAVIVPPEAEGKPLSINVERRGKLVDSKAIVYCGDKTCSKGERATTCPSDCILGGLSPQQGSKKIPYIAAGMLLLIVSGAILYVVTKKGQ